MAYPKHKIVRLLKLDNWINKKVIRISEKLYGPIVIPLLMTLKYRSETFLWFLFIFIGGQLGTIINLINRCIFQGYSFQAALYPDSIFGNFYTYALVLIASLIHPLLIRIKNNETPIYRTITTIYSSLLIFALIITAVFFSFSSQQPIGIIDTNYIKGNFTLDTKQFTIFICAFVLAIYSHGLSLMYKDEYAKEIDDDYIDQENLNRDTLTRSAIKLNTDEGIKYE